MCVVLQELTARNRQLLKDKKVLLVQNKVEFERIEKEKVGFSLKLEYKLFSQFSVYSVIMTHRNWM